jgi:hypothetical protein
VPREGPQLPHDAAAPAAAGPPLGRPTRCGTRGARVRVLGERGEGHGAAGGEGAGGERADGSGGGGVGRHGEDDAQVPSELPVRGHVVAAHGNCHGGRAGELS